MSKFIVGASVGAFVGASVGASVGAFVGASVGASVGAAVTQPSGALLTYMPPEQAVHEPLASQAVHAPTVAAVQQRVSQLLVEHCPLLLHVVPSVFFKRHVPPER